MSALDGPTFDVGLPGHESIAGGSSVLITGAELAALESVFFRLASPSGDEQPLVVSTAHDARTVRRNLDTAPGVEPTILTTEGRGRDDAVTVVDDPGDLTELGMELSARFQEHADETVRAGLFHTTELCNAASDTRAVYRFLNSNLLTNLRRQSALGVAAIHTDADLRADVDSIARGMETSFTGRVHVKDVRRTEATVTVSGFGADGEYTIDL